jgi:hypothetical protein
VVLSNALFHNINVLLVALIKPQTKAALLSQFQIPVTIEEQASYINLLDIASVSAKRLKATEINLQSYREQIKAGLDLLIDGF